MVYILIAETTLFCPYFKGDFCLANTDVSACTAAVISFLSKSCKQWLKRSCSNQALRNRFWRLTFCGKAPSLNFLWFSNTLSLLFSPPPHIPHFFSPPEFWEIPCLESQTLFLEQQYAIPTECAVGQILNISLQSRGATSQAAASQVKLLPPF